MVSGSSRNGSSIYVVAAVGETPMAKTTAVGELRTTMAAAVTSEAPPKTE